MSFRGIDMNIKKNGMKFALEFQNTIKTNLKKKEGSAKEKDVLKEGSTEVYTDELVPLLLQLPRNSQQLFWILVKERDEWNQVHKSREEMGSIYMKTYYKSNFSNDINRLVDLKMVAIIGYIPTISPFLILPKNTPQIQKTIQAAWKEMLQKEADNNERSQNELMKNARKS